MDSQDKPITTQPRKLKAARASRLSDLSHLDAKSEVFDKVFGSWTATFPGADLTSVSLSVSVSRLAALFNRGVEDLVRPHGFGYGELEVLFYLLSDGKPYEKRPSDLTKGCFVTSGAITGRVDRLVRLGLVTRIPSLIDRREMVVRLTREGERLARRLQTITAHESLLATALADLPQDRRQQLDSDLRQLLLRMEDLTETDRKPAAKGR